MLPFATNTGPIDSNLASDCEYTPSRRMPQRSPAVLTGGHPRGSPTAAKHHLGFPPPTHEEGDERRVPREVASQTESCVCVCVCVCCPRLQAQQACCCHTTVTDDEGLKRGSRIAFLPGCDMMCDTTHIWWPETVMPHSVACRQNVSNC